MYAASVKFISARSFVFSTAFASFARIRETCFICKQATADSDGTDNFLPETENYTISVCFLHGFRTGDKVPGLSFVVAGVRITTGTPVQFIRCFAHLEAKIWQL